MMCYVNSSRTFSSMTIKITDITHFIITMVLCSASFSLFVGKLMYVVRKLMFDNDGGKKQGNCLIISHNVFCVDALSVCPLCVGIH